MVWHGRLPPALPRPFDRPIDRDGIRPGAETIDLVRAQVNALVAGIPAYHDLSVGERRKVRDRLVHIAAYVAELLRSDWALSAQLGQYPLIKTRHVLTPERPRRPRAGAGTLAAADDFQPAAASQIGRVTEETLRAIAFPTFVADLIKSTFQAIVNATIQQMEAFGDMLANVSKTVDEFMSDNISEDQARGWLAQRYPSLIRIRQGGERPELEVTDAADEQALPDFQRELNTPDRISSLDEDIVEEVLVPAARRRLAQTRLQMLSTMIMLGLQRIVVTHGRIKATMGFHIDTTDRARAEEASLLDTSVAAKASGWYMGFSASVATSVTYVRSTKSDSESAINVIADLSGEVDLTFETDYLPLNRFANSARIEQIRANTPNPAANAPSPQAGAGQPSGAVAAGAESALRTHLEHRSAPNAPDLPDLPSHEARQGPQQSARNGPERPAAEASSGQTPQPEPPAANAPAADAPSGDAQAGRRSAGGNDDSDRWFCSELIFAAFEAAGRPLGTRPAASTPEGFVELDPPLEYVGHLKAIEVPAGSQAYRPFSAPVHALSADCTADVKLRLFIPSPAVGFETGSLQVGQAFGGTVARSAIAAAPRGAKSMPRSGFRPAAASRRSMCCAVCGARARSTMSPTSTSFTVGQSGGWKSGPGPRRSASSRSASPTRT
jgi:hypothetical protein